MTHENSAVDRPNAQSRHERILQTARGLLSDAESDAEVLEHCCSVLSKPGRDRALAQASLDATNVFLALSDADVDTKRTREARQLLTAITGGRHE